MNFLLLFTTFISYDLLQFQTWMSNFNISYENNTNVTEKFNNWLYNRDMIYKHNNGDHSFELELNKFADMKNDWKTRRGQTAHL